MEQYSEFIYTIQTFYKDNYRSMPWRENTDPYYVLVSEFMLQQTQVTRVIPKFKEFIVTFPTIQSLASATFGQVVEQWSGLGYNRRARFLHECAKHIIKTHGGVVPKQVEELVALPGIGPNTAKAILVYAYNIPVVFIETNIRAVYIHEFFHDAIDVSDNDLLPIIEDTLDNANPREWYWALMDYGTHIKKAFPNPSRKSKHHIKQSPFEGSKRQLRGRVLKGLIQGIHDKESLHIFCNHDARFNEVLKDMEKDKLVKIHNSTILLSD